MEKLKIGYAICGSFCTFRASINSMKELIDKGHDVTPIMSFNAYNTDTRFGKAKDFIEEIESLCKKNIIHTIVDAEPIGPKKMFDILVVAPCTGNTIAKLANSIVDTPVTLAVKSHIRNCNPVVILVSTNDALSGSSKNIGKLLNSKHYYFVPMSQDDCIKKPTSIVGDFSKIYETIQFALKGIQIQPILT